MESRPAEYNRPVCWSSWSAFTPDRWRGSSSSLITNDMVTFRLGMAWLWGWPWEWPEDGRIPAAILHLFLSQLFHYQISSFSVKLRACFARATLPSFPVSHILSFADWSKFSIETKTEEKTKNLWVICGPGIIFGHVQITKHLHSTVMSQESVSTKRCKNDQWNNFTSKFCAVYYLGRNVERKLWLHFRNKNF